LHLQRLSLSRELASRRAGGRVGFDVVVVVAAGCAGN